MKPNQFYMFKKSGSVVEIVETHNKPYGGMDLTVRRVDTGKRMLVTKSSLIPLKKINACPYCDHEVRSNESCCQEHHSRAIWVTDDLYQNEIKVPERSIP